MVWSKGSGRGSVGRAVATNSKGLQFKYSHQQNLLGTFISSQLYGKEENKEKRGREWHIFLKKRGLILFSKHPSFALFGWSSFFDGNISTTGTQTWGSSNESALKSYAVTPKYICDCVTSLELWFFRLFDSWVQIR